MAYSQAAWLIPVFPLAAFLVLTALGRSFRRSAPIIASIGTLGSLALSVLVMVEGVEYRDRINWIKIGDLSLSIGFDVNHLTSLMLVIVSIVSFLVCMYSAGYMRDDERLTVFYGYVSLFVFAMMGLVLADNMLMLYLFWELVGVCSFLLVGFWYHKPEAKAAAKKAFIVTRIGDAGLLLAVLLLFWYMPNHALDFVGIQNVFQGQSGAVDAQITTLIALLVFMGAIGKSGQFPLHVWLPDAMEGPTPISALIHAATMVAAGVFLIARTFVLFEASAVAMDTVAYIGAFTALFAASIALVQHDVKRILAYSTISQLGYMMMALGVGSLTGAIFHLMTHAFFKALLFLGAGSIIHATKTQDIRELGGLGGRMRLTALLFGVGALALSGIPPFAGFWSKDTILAAALDSNPALFAAGLLGALLTALYMARLFFRVFAGKPSAISEAAHESPAVMTIPMLALAVLALGAGFVETPWYDGLSQWLLGDEAPAHAADGYTVPIIGAAVALLGLYIGWLAYVKRTIRLSAALDAMPSARRLLENGYGLDALYTHLIVKPYRLLGSCVQLFDRYVVDGLVQLAAFGVSALGRGTARLQNGQVQTYGLAAVIGLLVLIVVLAGRRLWS
ncbi:proton-translocating NADH-quinone oxidoreductase, chain L [Paenibacillus curdlanolyticus YK9]|uniref:Proton-translocating NADH-quinone oxidoreductase, chain L n=1 Tax=Paenibacillus curdlanolyticus YK9 TaxID=717606 RepID=E0IEH9_9BACL|nr:NADH-quinone oxidoreductase subunit L [Paenibacillus curdlanolyticus]EFM09067.1 proton-translocating NADH-quinone oxidoreductase, chain L [Paenibacillus curdlanolyticus YK9]